MKKKEKGLRALIEERSEDLMRELLRLHERAEKLEAWVEAWGTRVEPGQFEATRAFEAAFDRAQAGQFGSVAAGAERPRQPLVRQKPWVEAGMSRNAYYRLKREEQSIAEQAARMGSSGPSAASGSTMNLDLSDEADDRGSEG